MEIGLFFLGIGIIAWLVERWWKARVAEAYYRDGLFHIIAILDLPLDAWEKKLRGTMSADEWFGFQRGYQSGLLDALRLLHYSQHLHLHGSMLQPTPNEEDSLSDYAKR